MQHGTFQMGGVFKKRSVVSEKGIPTAIVQPCFYKWIGAHAHLALIFHVIRVVVFFTNAQGIRISGINDALS